MPPTREEMLSFSTAIENMVNNTDYTYLEAIVDHCSKTGLEIEVAATLIHSSLKSKIEVQVGDLNLLKHKPNRLPI